MIMDREVEVLKWAKTAQELGAGEVLVTSVDKRGLGLGIDIELLKNLRSAVSIPIIYSGGGKVEDILDSIPYADGIALASILHYDKYDIKEFKENT